MTVKVVGVIVLFQIVTFVLTGGLVPRGTKLASAAHANEEASLAMSQSVVYQAPSLEARDAAGDSGASTQLGARKARVS